MITPPIAAFLIGLMIGMFAVGLVVSYGMDVRPVADWPTWRVR